MKETNVLYSYEKYGYEVWTGISDSPSPDMGDKSVKQCQECTSTKIMLLERRQTNGVLAFKASCIDCGWVSGALPYAKPTVAYGGDPFYQSRQWLELRYQVLRIHGFACMACNRNRKDGIKLHVDHIKPRSKYPALQLDINNLQVLCSDCNLGKSNKFEDDLRQ